ncbi:hypothetical protein F5Y10DRAFT_292580 [Nemania abortiva]|nr:hypothetical protein F5Y10DRAFT_292580 [Nemania abortiva]
MADLVSLADMSTVPSSIDSTPLANTAASIRANFRRTKSMGYTDNTQDPRKPTIVDQREDEDRRTRSNHKSPVRANSARRRSVASMTRLQIGTRYRSEASYRTNLTPPRSGSVELGSVGHRDISSPAVSPTRTQSTSASRQRSLSRGRTRRRSNTPLSSNPGRGTYPHRDKGSRSSRRRQYAKGGMTPIGQAEYPPSFDAGVVPDNASPYVRKGLFRLSYNQEPQIFRFPKSRSQPELSWQAGDGFSDDELLPRPIFTMMGKHKRKRSKSLSAFGQLSVEAQNVADNDAVGLTSSQQHYRLSGLRRNNRGVGAKDMWPTRENFLDDSIAPRPRNVVAKERSSTKSTTPTTPKSKPMSKSETQQTIPRKRRPSDFENFGRHKRRPQSRHIQHQYSSLTQELECQVSGDEYYEEEDDGELYERERYESESEGQSVLDENIEYSSSMASDREGSDIGSEELGEHGDLEEDIQDTIQDSQPYEVPDSSPSWGTIRLVGTAWSASSLLGDDVYYL